LTDYLVKRQDFDAAVEQIARHDILSIDTETTGLRVHHGDNLFSVVFGNGEDAWYFNFGVNSPPEYQIPLYFMFRFQERLFDKPHILWFAHNAKFDMGMLSNAGHSINGVVWDTEVMARVENNVHLDYSLAACASRIGLEKNSALDDFIQEQGLWEWQSIPGKDRRVKKPFFTKVPFNLIAEYACQDARVTYALGMYQRASLQDMDAHRPTRTRPILDVATNEARLTQITFAMENRGVLIEPDLCHAYIDRLEGDRIDALQSFRVISGGLEPVPTTFKAMWQGNPAITLTDKGNYSFDADAMDRLVVAGVEGAAEVLKLRAIKNKLDFLNGFMYHSDTKFIIHTNFRQAGTKTGRFSSTAPNLQNLAKPDSDAPPDSIEVRKCIIPRPGFCFVMMDMDQAEYRLMLDLAGAHGLIEQVLGGLDVHQATADLAGITRKEAKQTNFAILYGSGVRSLADGLGIDVSKARSIVEAIFRAAPEIKQFINTVQERALYRGYVVNWFGRRCHLDNPNFAYKMPNALIQGGVADVVKLGMVQVDQVLSGMKSAMVLNIHDELVFEIHESELNIIPQLNRVLKNIYPRKYLPLTWGIAHSWENLAEKIEGLPVVGNPS
jgi:DNA polymerase-1